MQEYFQLSMEDWSETLGLADSDDYDEIEDQMDSNSS